VQRSIVQRQFALIWGAAASCCQIAGCSGMADQRRELCFCSIVHALRKCNASSNSNLAVGALDLTWCMRSAGIQRALALVLQSKCVAIYCFALAFAFNQTETTMACAPCSRSRLSAFGTRGSVKRQVVKNDQTLVLLPTDLRAIARRTRRTPWWTSSTESVSMKAVKSSHHMVLRPMELGGIV
jgi:hypothetical protein